MTHSRGRARRRYVKRSWGLAGAAVRSLAFLFLVTACVFAVRWVIEKSTSFNSQIGPQQGIQSFQFADGTPTDGIQPRNRRLVYPYSVIPGGVSSPQELREVAQHDPVVGAHYSGFDYSRARVIEVDRPRVVYVSYRSGGKVHWSRKQATLHKGEKLLTDGRIMARTRCGNQVSVLPQADTLPEEPTMAELERPDAVASGTEAMFPQTSTALALDPGVAIAPPYASYPQLGGFMPIGGGGVVASCPPNDKKKSNTKKTKDKCNTESPTPPPPTVPEPGTLALFLSGGAAVYTRYRRRRS